MNIKNIKNLRVKLMSMATVLFVGLMGFFLASCDDELDIQQSYPFTVETMPVPKELKMNETAEIRCELKREGRWEDARYTIRWFLFDGEGTLKLDATKSGPSCGNFVPGAGRYVKRKGKVYSGCGACGQHKSTRFKAGRGI